jgi:multisubunit Na+/H+ antiporter MnhB subunit
MDAKDAGQLMLFSAVMVTYAMGFGILPRRSIGPSGRVARRVLVLALCVGALGAGLSIYSLFR